MDDYATRAVPTNDTRTQTWEVRSLDVWGHAPSECDTSCPCVRVIDDETGSVDHDKGMCECGFEVNDSSVCGSIDVEAEGTRYNVGTAHEFASYHATDAALLAALVGGDYLASDVNGKPIADVVRIDGDAGDGTFLVVESIETGRPLLHLSLNGGDAS